MSIYEYERTLSKLETAISDADYPQEWKTLLLNFENALFAEGIKHARVIKYLSQMNLMFRDYALSPNSSKDDLYRVIGKLERTDLSPHTKHAYKVSIKRFFRWINNGEDPECTKWIKSTIRDNQKMPEELLTEDEIKNMISVANNLRDRALIATLYDSGARISEIGNLKIRNLIVDKIGAVLQVNGKTGRRRVRIIFSVPYILKWIEFHPDKNNPDAPLWVNIGKWNYGKQMKYNAFTAVIKKTAKKAGITKRVHNHLFRHSRSTELAQYMTQAQMESHLGWTHGSKMPRTYIHLSGKQVDDALLKMYGMQNEDKLEPDLTLIECTRCREINGPDAKFCCRCGAALSTEYAVNADERREELAEYVMDLVEKDPRIMKLFRNLK